MAENRIIYAIRYDGIQEYEVVKETEKQLKVKRVGGSPYVETWRKSENEVFETRAGALEALVARTRSSVNGMRARLDKAEMRLAALVTALELQRRQEGGE